MSRRQPAWARALLAVRDRLDPVVPGWAYAHLTYAQDGDDVLLGQVFRGQRRGVYVDVGAHHPYRYSNTYALYRRGWHGLAVDAMPGSATLFRRRRPRDTVVEIGVAERPAELLLHVFDDPLLTTFDPDLARERDGRDGHRVVRTVPVPCRPLRDLVAEHRAALPGRIDLLSIDVEGLDLPAALAGPTASYLAGHGYRPIAKTLNNLVFTAPDGPG